MVAKYVKVRRYLETTVPLPSHHPDVAPLVPEGLGARVLDALVLATHALPAKK